MSGYSSHSGLLDNLTRIVRGSAGDDTIYAQNGWAVLGQEGDDILISHWLRGGESYLFGGTGNDQFYMRSPVEIYANDDEGLGYSDWIILEGQANEVIAEVFADSEDYFYVRESSYTDINVSNLGNGDWQVTANHIHPDVGQSVVTFHDIDSLTYLGGGWYDIV